MDFESLERRYLELWRLLHENKIDAEAFRAEVEDLMIQDAEGRYWAIGAESGYWYYYDGNEWQQWGPMLTVSTPPLEPSPVEEPLEQPAPPAAVAPPPAASEAAPKAEEPEAGPAQPLPAEEAKETEAAAAPQPMVEVAETAEVAAPQRTHRPSPRPAAPWRARLASLPGGLWIAAGGVVVLIVGAAVVAALLSRGERRTELEAAREATPTLAMQLAAFTPTPGPTPTDVPTATPTPTLIPLISYQSDSLGLQLSYPATWRSLESEGELTLSPTQRSSEITRPEATRLVLGSSLAGVNSASDLLADLILQIEATGGQITPRPLEAGGVTWLANLIEYQPRAGEKAIALVGAVVHEGVGYTLHGAAPAEDWEKAYPKFLAVLDTLSFTPRLALEPTTPTSTATSTAEGTAQTAAVTYEVQPGDTLLAIAQRFGVSAEALQAANDIARADLLRIGQELVIPGAVAEAAAPLLPEETPQGPLPSPEPSPQATVAAPAAALGGRIAYPAFNSSLGTFEVWLSDPGGANQQLLATSASAPRFSRDGGMLLYRSWKPNERGIYYKDFLSGKEGLLTTYLEDSLSAWLADNYSLVFASRREGDRTPRIFRVSLQGGDDQSLNLVGEYVDVSPTGKLVVKGCVLSECGLYLAPAGGGSGEIISRNTSDTAPAFSPDGSRIAFMSNTRDGAGNWEIYVMNEDGANVRRLTDNPAADGLPAWSPDGTSIAFVSNRGGAWAIWAMNTDGSNQRQLFAMRGSPEGVVAHDEPNSRGWLEERISWAP